MAIPVLILGPSGVGKTYSLRNLPNEGYGLIECQKNMLPFPGGKRFARTKDFDQLKQYIQAYAAKCPIVVVDDLGYCATDLYIKHIDDRDQFGVYKMIAAEMYNLFEFVNDVGGQTIVYFTMHTDTDAMNNIIPKIMGKMVNEKIDLLGMLNVVILAEMADNEHVFTVSNKPPAKSCGAFSQDRLPNDLAIVDKGLREFMGWTNDESEAPTD